MAITVNIAFNEFMRDKVNLNAEVTKKARKSRDNLIENIHTIGKKDSFFNLYTEKDICFGSFARRTKIRPLNDIDQMICISADYTTYLDYGDRIEMTVASEDSPQVTCCNDNTKILNSTKVINKFKSELKLLTDYKEPLVQKSGEAATMQLKSYTWNFDIVPCFFTQPTTDGKTYYIIPDGCGNWKKTDPRIDRDKIAEVNQKHGGLVLDVIRLVKYWNKRPTMPSAPPYLMECLLVNYFDNLPVNPKEIYRDLHFKNVLCYISNWIFQAIDDPKGVQGNLNTLTYEEKLKISSRALDDHNKAVEAVKFETVDNDHKKSIKKWKEIFGNEFPEYGE